ncbi:hypothetical protein NPIL_596891 [Nephila pilipes]|uniref:Uncharacterized protein n=1 Tax=Nephila pilipes TaxID=299642 RepID=A0A8X6TPK8_NEPPI|nr:hypothetical protein NPIL_596891 [Nephila pilipes]
MDLLDIHQHILQRPYMPSFLVHNIGRSKKNLYVMSLPIMLGSLHRFGHRHLVQVCTALNGLSPPGESSLSLQEMDIGTQPEIDLTAKCLCGKTIGCYREVNMQTSSSIPYSVVRQRSNPTKRKHNSVPSFNDSYFWRILGCFETEKLEEWTTDGTQYGRALICGCLGPRAHQTAQHMYPLWTGCNWKNRAGHKSLTSSFLVVASNRSLSTCDCFPVSSVFPCMLNSFWIMWNVSRLNLRSFTYGTRDPQEDLLWCRQVLEGVRLLPILHYPGEKLRADATLFCFPPVLSARPRRNESRGTWCNGERRCKWIPSIMPSHCYRTGDLFCIYQALVSRDSTPFVGQITLYLFVWNKTIWLYGDKLCSFHGQKGVLLCLIKFVTNIVGRKIFNPTCYESLQFNSMTPGQISLEGSNT